MSLSLASGPAVEPLTKDEAKAHLRLDVDDHEDDARLDMLIEAAREMVTCPSSSG